jgi:hypothetical protein
VRIVSILPVAVVCWGGLVWSLLVCVCVNKNGHFLCHDLGGVHDVQSPLRAAHDGGKHVRIATLIVLEDVLGLAYEVTGQCEGNVKKMVLKRTERRARRE